VVVDAAGRAAATRLSYDRAAGLWRDSVIPIDGLYIFSLLSNRRPINFVFGREAQTCCACAVSLL
jgi:hypothetical protein